jgi:hypothetical protein
MARFRTQEINTHLQLVENYAARGNRAFSLTDQKSVVLIRLQMIEKTRKQIMAISGELRRESASSGS